MPGGTGNWPVPRIDVRLRGLIEEAILFLRDLAGRPAHPRYRPGGRAATKALVPPAPKSVRQPVVSLIVLNRDRADLIEALFESFHRVNRYPHVELILVDHGSRDGSVAVAERWSDRLPIAIVRSPTNHSFSYSCNRAAEQASGEIIVLLNNDVVFCDDVLGAMVDRIEADGGIVGLRLFDSAVERAADEPGHIGVRPCWNPGHRVVGGFNSRRLPCDALIGHQPARMLAVTGALLMCRQDDYLRLGGLLEEYLYGYEDVDFCQKARLGAGLPITCMNDLAALHREGATRFAVIRGRIRRTWHRHNIAIVNRRFGYALRREIMTNLFADDGSFLGRRPNVAIRVSPTDRERFEPLVEALESSLGWQTRWLEAGADPYDLRGADLLILADPAYRLDLIRHRHPMLATIAWTAPGPVRPDLARFDLVFGTEPRSDLAVPVIPLDPGAPEAAVVVAARLQYYWSKSHRFCLRAATTDAALAEALALRLRKAGQHVRILIGRAWRPHDGMRDDVLVHLSPGDHQTAPARINLALAMGSDDEDLDMDALIEPGDEESLAQVILHQADRHRAIRMRAPEDPPLTRSGNIDASRDGWQAHPDPTYPLLVAAKRG